MAIVHANAQTFPQEVLQSNETVLVDFGPPGAVPARCWPPFWRSWTAWLPARS